MRKSELSYIADIAHLNFPYALPECDNIEHSFCQVIPYFRCPQVNCDVCINAPTSDNKELQMEGTPACYVNFSAVDRLAQYGLSTCW